MYKVCSADSLALVLVVFPQKEVAISLQRIVDAAPNLSIVQEQRAICTAAGRTVRLVLGRVTGCASLISTAPGTSEFEQPLTGIVKSESDRIGCGTSAPKEARLQVCGNVVPDLWARAVGCWRCGLFQCGSSLRYERWGLRIPKLGSSCSCTEADQGHQEDAGFHTGDLEVRECCDGGKYV